MQFNELITQKKLEYNECMDCSKILEKEAKDEELHGGEKMLLNSIYDILEGAPDSINGLRTLRKYNEK